MKSQTAYLERLARERGGSVTKRRRFSTPDYKPIINSREGENLYRGRPCPSAPGRYRCIVGSKVLDWPERVEHGTA